MENDSRKSLKIKPKAIAFAKATSWAKSQKGSNYGYISSVLKIPYNDLNNIRQGRVNPTDEMVDTLERHFPGFNQVYDEALKEAGHQGKKSIEDLRVKAEKEKEEIKGIVLMLVDKVNKIEDRLENLEKKEK